MKSNIGSAPLEQDDIIELHLIRTKWFIDKGIEEPSAMMAYLSAEFVGTLALQGYSDEFVKSVFERMLEKFKNHPLRTRRYE